MKIKEKLIRLLGGYTKEDKLNAFINIYPLYQESKTYYLDDDSLTVEKEQLAYKLAKEMLDNDLIDFTIIKDRDKWERKLYTICARIFINTFNT